MFNIHCKNMQLLRIKTCFLLLLQHKHWENEGKSSSSDNDSDSDLTNMSELPQPLAE
jgi:hypothetical protein